MLGDISAARDGDADCDGSCGTAASNSASSFVGSEYASSRTEGNSSASRGTPSTYDK